MGCTTSYVPNTTNHSPESTKETTIPLTTEQKMTVRETWRIIEPNKKDMGVKVYVRFLTEYPDYKLRFTEFKNIVSLDEISTRSVHVKRMLAALENSVSSLDDGETFSEYALELGRRHAALNVKPTTSQFKDLKKVVLCTLKEFLPNNWSFQAEESWGLILDLLGSVMLRGINSKS